MSIDETCKTLTKNLLVTYGIYNCVEHILLGVLQTVFCDVHTFHLPEGMQERQ
jgi:hypothetical protein